MIIFATIIWLGDGLFCNASHSPDGSGSLWTVSSTEQSYSEQQEIASKKEKSSDKIHEKTSDFGDQ